MQILYQNHAKNCNRCLIPLKLLAQNANSFDKKFKRCLIRITVIDPNADFAQKSRENFLKMRGSAQFGRPEYKSFVKKSRQKLQTMLDSEQIARSESEIFYANHASNLPEVSILIRIDCSRVSQPAMDGRTRGPTDERGGPTDRRTDRRTDRQTKGRTDRRADRRTDGWAYGLTD